MSLLRSSLGTRTAEAGVILGLVVFVTWSAATIVWLLLSSILPQLSLIDQPPDISFVHWTLDNYITVIGSAAALGRGMLNSFIVAAFTTAMALALGAPAAYALARLSVPRSGTVVLLILATQMLPAIAIAISALHRYQPPRAHRHAFRADRGLPVVQPADRDLDSQRFLSGCPRRAGACSGGGRRRTDPHLLDDRAADLHPHPSALPPFSPLSSPGTNSSSR